MGVVSQLVSFFSPKNVGNQSNDVFEEIHFCMMQGKNIPLFKALIDKNPNLINHQDSLGRTLLISAIHLNKSPEIINFLLEKGADLNIKDSTGKTALDYAFSYTKNDEIMNSLIEKNAEYTIESNYTLVQNGTKKINDQNINALDAYDKTPLMWAVQFGKTEIVKELLAKGADVNFKNSYAMTALYYCNDANIIKTLISNGADINSRDKQGQTAFMNAASGINTAKMEALFNINNDVINIKDDHGYTPLMLTLQKSQQGINYDKIIKAVDFLLEKGADITIKNNDNNTALEMVIFSPDHNDDFKIQFIQTLCDKDKINIKQIFENKKIAEGFKMKFIQAACKNGKITGDELIEKLYDNQNIDSDSKNKFLTALFQDKTINKDFKYKLFSNLNDAGKISEVQQHDYQNCINISSSKSTFAER